MIFFPHFVRLSDSAKECKVKEQATLLGVNKKKLIFLYAAQWKPSIITTNTEGKIHQPNNQRHFTGSNFRDINCLLFFIELFVVQFCNKWRCDNQSLHTRYLEAFNRNNPSETTTPLHVKPYEANTHKHAVYFARNYCLSLALSFFVSYKTVSAGIVLYDDLR